MKFFSIEKAFKLLPQSFVFAALTLDGRKRISWKGILRLELPWEWKLALGSRWILTKNPGFMSKTACYVWGEVNITFYHADGHKRILKARVRDVPDLYRELGKIIENGFSF